MLSAVKLLFSNTSIQCRRINLIYKPYGNKTIVRLITATAIKDVIPTYSKFSKTENQVLYQHLKSNKNYRNTIAFLDYVNEKSTVTEDVSVLLNTDQTQLPNRELVENFKTILHSYCKDCHKLNEPQFVKFCEHVIGRVPNLLDDELLNILKILSLWPRLEDDGNDDLFFRICKAIDNETLKRSRCWDRDKLLLTMDHFHRLQVANFSSFNWENLKRLCRNPDSLTSPQLVQTLFLVMCNRQWHPGVNMFDWELALTSKIYEMSAEEATIVALGFFKTNKKITNQNLLNALMLKMETRTDTLDSVSLTALLKVIRFSIPFSMRDRLLPLLDSLKDDVDKHSLTCCVHMALLGTRQPILHTALLNKISCRFVNEISNARLKEIERMLFVTSMFNFIPHTNPNFFDRIIEELKNRDSEIVMYSRSLIYAVQFLCVQKVFDYDLINKVLSENFLIASCKEISKFSIPCNVVEIACSAKLECPDYDGNNLKTELINEFSNHYNYKSCAVINKMKSKREVIYMQSKTKLEEIFGGPQFVHVAHVLPYSNSPDLIFCLKDGKPVALSEEIRKKYCIDFEPASKIGDWYAMVVWRSGTTIRNTGKPVGSIHSRLRHLRLLGYKCSLLKEDTWVSLETDKIQYLNSLIKTSL